MSQVAEVAPTRAPRVKKKTFLELTSEEKKAFFAGKKKVLKTKAELKAALASHRSSGSRSSGSRSSGSRTLGDNPSSAWLVGVQPVPRPVSDSLWTRDVAAGSVITSYSLTNYGQELNFSVGDISISFNGIYDDTFFDSESGPILDDNSNIRFTSGEFSQLQASNVVADSVWYGIRASEVQSFTGVVYGTGSNNDNHFNEVRVVPLILDSNGLATTWRLDVDRAFEEGNDLAVQFIVELKQYAKYSEINISCLQTQSEIVYSNDGGDSSSTLQMAFLTPSSDGSDISSSTTVGDFYSTGGVIISHDEDRDIYPWTGIQVYNEFDTVADSNLTGLTISMRIPSALDPVTAGTVQTVTTGPEIKKVTFGFDLTTLLFVLLIVVVAIFMVMYSMGYMAGKFPFIPGTSVSSKVVPVTSSRLSSTGAKFS